MDSKKRVFSKIANIKKETRKIDLSMMDTLSAVDGLDFLVPFSQFLNKNVSAFEKQCNDFEDLIKQHEKVGKELGLDWEKDIWEANGYFAPKKMLEDNKKLLDLLKGEVGKLAGAKI